MTQIALEGLILAVFVYAPLVFYSVWSWRVLRRSGDEMYSRRIGLRLLAMAAIVSIIWSIVVNAIAVFNVLLTYNLTGEESSFADAVFAVAFLPVKVAFGVIDFIPWMPIYYTATWLYWLLASGMIVILLLSISTIECLFIRRVHLSEKRQGT